MFQIPLNLSSLLTVHTILQSVGSSKSLVLKMYECQLKLRFGAHVPTQPAHKIPLNKCYQLSSCRFVLDHIIIRLQLCIYTSIILASTSNMLQILSSINFVPTAAVPAVQAPVPLILYCDLLFSQSYTYFLCIQSVPNSPYKSEGQFVWTS